MRPQRDRPLFCSFFLLISLFLVFFAFPALSASSDSTSLDDAVRQLAERVSAITNLRSPVRLQFLQDANLVSDTGKGWQETFRKELEGRHFTLTEDPDATLLHVGLAETPTQLVLSASARVADKDEVRIISLPRSAFRAANLPVAPIRIERQFVFQSSHRILDASSLWNGSDGGMALLSCRGTELSALRLDATGQVTQTISLSTAGVHLSRDPRGELTVRANDAVVLLPGKSCEFSWTSPADVKCHFAKTAWRSPTVLTPSCDAGGWKLLADGSDWTSPDVLQVMPDGSSHEGSAALLSDFPGPILAINGEQNPAGALVVTRNLRTGNYEVYKITLACGN
ncbi:MAG: hypothetical protein WBL63_04630 [Candidatus Acidiferrum sp.]